ncbi:MAG: FHA domain-containing protein [Acidobacteriota bacterium]
MPVILEKKEKQTVKTHKIEKQEIFIGRGKENDIIIPVSSISHKHAKIFKKGDKYYIEDLKSSNGIFINKKRIVLSRISSGDEIYLGNYKIVFLEEEEREDKTVVLSDKQLIKELEIKTGERRSYIPFILGGLSLILAFFLIYFVGFRKGIEKEKVISEDVSHRRTENSIEDIILKGREVYENAILFRNVGREEEAKESLEMALTYFDEALIMNPENKVAIKYKELIKDFEMTQGEKVEKKEPEILKKKQEILSKIEETYLEAKTYEKEGKKKEAFTKYKEVIENYQEIKAIPLEREPEKKTQEIFDNSKEFVVVSMFEQNFYSLKNEFEKIKKLRESPNVFSSYKEVEKFLDKAQKLLDRNRGLKSNMIFKLEEIIKEAEGIKREIKSWIDKEREEAERYYHEGILYESVKNYAKALEKWKTALEKAPKEDVELINKIKEKISKYE